MDIAGWRIFYGDGTIVSSLSSTWEQCEAENVQMVTFYFDRSYEIYRGEKWDTESYCEQMCEADYYWFDGKTFGCGNAKEVPLDLPKGGVKVGKLLLDEEWWKIYNAAKEVRTL